MAKFPIFDNITAAFASASKLNANFASIVASLTNTLSRDGSTPNSMTADFDLNNNDLLNAKTINTTGILVNGVDITTAIANPVLQITRNQIATTTINTATVLLTTAGFATVGDGGAASYKRVSIEPTHSLKVTSQDGAFWEIVPDAGGTNVRQAGAVGDGIVDNTVELQATIDFAITVAASTGQATVILPTGDYLVSRAFTSHTAEVIDGCLRIDGDNVRVIGPGRIVFNLGGAATPLTVVLVLRGDNLEVNGVGFHNTFIVSGNFQQNWNIGFGDGLDDGSNTTRTYKNFKILNTIHTGGFFYATNFRLTGTTSQVAEDILLANNRAIGDTASAVAGCYNFGGFVTTAGQPVRSVRLTDNYSENVPSSAHIALLRVRNFIAKGNIMVNGDFAGIEPENTAGRAVMVGNVAIDVERAFWADDCQHVIIMGNVVDNPTTRTDAIRVTRETETVDYVHVQGNTILNGQLRVNTFGVGGGSFATVIIADNSLELDGSTHAQGIVITSTDRVICRGNVVVGASADSIQISTKDGEFALIQGNMTAKTGAESSNGFNNLGGGTTAKVILLGNNFENGVTGAITNNILDWNSTDPHFEMSEIRLEEDKGSDVVAATTLTFGDANFFTITGNTTINHITTTGWQSGAHLTLHFSGTPTLTHNAASPPANTGAMFLSGSANFVVTAGSLITFRSDGASWREESRTVR